MAGAFFGAAFFGAAFLTTFFGATFLEPPNMVGEAGARVDAVTTEAAGTVKAAEKATSVATRRTRRRAMI